MINVNRIHILSTMENLSSLSRTLPSAPHANLDKEFKDAALAVTKLYKMGASQYKEGYHDAMSELVQIIQEGTSVDELLAWALTKQEEHGVRTSLSSSYTRRSSASRSRSKTAAPSSTPPPQSTQHNHSAQHQHQQHHPQSQSPPQQSTVEEKEKERGRELERERERDFDFRASDQLSLDAPLSSNIPSTFMGSLFNFAASTESNPNSSIISGSSDSESDNDTVISGKRRKHGSGNGSSGSGLESKRIRF